MDIEQIKKNYADFDDFKIEHIAKNEVDGLHPEVVPILVDEIKRRGLDLNLIKGIESQTKELTGAELDELKSKIVNLPCPDCGQRAYPLTGSFSRTVISFFIFTSYKKKPVIACQSCLNKRRKNAMLLTFFLGWWGIPYGFFRTPIALIASLKDIKNKGTVSEDTVTSFAISHIGELRTNWDKENELVAYINHWNEIIG
jgi:hypothetical protein